MAEESSPGTPKKRGGRLRRGWELAKESWRVVKGDRSLLVFPLVSVGLGIVVAVVFFGPGIAIAAVTNSAWWILPFLIVGGFFICFIAQFFAVALAACATDALEGHDTTFGQGFSAARKRTGVIFQWSLVTFTVGAILSALQSLASGSDNAGAAIAGTIASAIAGFAWAVASFFVIPIIALEGLGPKDALKGSVAVIKERWGEGVFGNAAIGLAVFVVIFLPAILVGVGGVLLLGSAEALGLALIAIACLGIAVGSLFNFTITTVFRVALYRYATEGKVIGGFSEEAMADAFAPRHGRRHRGQAAA
jgi:MFS family permease